MDMTPVMRFQVANESVNMIQNPNGERGPWFYTTPITNTLLASVGDSMTFQTTISQPVYFISELMPVAAGEYVSSRFDLLSITTGHNVKIRYNWHDANQVYMYGSTTSGALNTVGANIGPTIAAPSGTAYATLVVYLENGSTQASAGASVNFNKVMVKKTPSGSATSQRTNLVTNPNFAVDASGWVADNTSTTLGRTAAFYLSPGAGFIMRTDATGWAIGRTGNIGLTEKQTYTVSAYVAEYAGDVVASCKIGIEWFTAAGKSLGTKWGPAINPSASWTRISMTGTAPGTATRGQVQIASYATVLDRLMFDAVLLEQSNIVGTYFDGATTDTSQVTYDWTSTANASTSTATSTSSYFDYVDPWDWRDILGTTADITIERGGLDAGTLTATIHDKTLDPVDNEVLAEGKTLRLQVLKNGDWVNRFEGEVDSLKVTYPAALSHYADVTAQTVIELTAIDNIQNLAGHKFVDANGKSIGVSVAHIPGIIEGASVPWLVNGSSSQVASITKLSLSDDATALDQIAIARDSERGYAWVNKDNVLVAVDAAHVDNTVKALLSDSAVLDGDPAASYRDIAVTASTDSIINSVTINKLSNNATDTQPVAYGPYRNTDSIAKFGEVTADFPYQGAIAGVAAFATSILDAQAWPVRRVESLVMPVKAGTLSWDYGCDLDLYDVVTVKYADKIDGDQRITRITEVFTVLPDRHDWEITLGFEAVGGVASPRTTGGTGRTTNGSSVAAILQSNTQTMTNAANTSVLWNTTVATHPEMTNSSSGITVTQDGLYRITGQVAVDNSGTTGLLHVGVRVNGTSLRTLGRTGFAAVAPTVLGGTTVLALSGGDVVTLVVYHSNGANRNLSGGTVDATTLVVEPV